MTKVFALSEEYKAIVDEVVARVRRMPTNTTRILNEETPPRNTDFLIAKPQVQISARSTTTPGSGTCDIFYIDTTGPTLTDAGFDLTVYNLVDQALTTDYTVITRDKYGQWIAVGGTFVCP